MKISGRDFFKTSDGTELHIQVHDNNHQHWLIATHGIGEHLNRHSYLVKVFNQRFNILQYDLRGHGRSFGKRGWVDDFNRFYQDLNEIIEFLKDEYKMKKYVLFGHSMGALITSGFVQRKTKPCLYPELIFLSGPPIAAGGALEKITEFMPKSIAQAIASIPYGLDIPGLIDFGALSHDPMVKRNMLKDPLCLKSLNTKLIFELVKNMKEVYTRPLHIRCPGIVCVGSEDKIISYKNCVEYFNRIEKGLKLKIFHGAYHEIHNEIPKYQKPYFEFLKQSIST